jgi:hypothetical protein
VIKKALLFLVLFSGADRLYSVVAVGDTPNSSTTFQFGIGLGIYDATAERLWTLSGDNTASLTEHVQSYGISYTPFIPVDNQSKATLTAFPYLPDQAIITTTENGSLILPDTSVDNPLLGQAFSTVTFLGTYLTTVVSEEPRYIYLIQATSFYDNKFGTISPYGFSIMNQLDMGYGNQVKQIAGSLQGILFIAHAQGAFGQPSSSSQISFASTAAVSANIAGEVISCTHMIEQASAPIRLNTPVLTANGDDIAAIGSSVVFYPIAQNIQMYTGLDVTASSTGQAVGLFLSQANLAYNQNPASVQFNSIVPDSVAKEDIQTPFSTTSSHRVCVADITTTVTSTGLSYLLNSRYDEFEQQFVYAMPLVTMANNSEDNGKIADFTEIDQQFKISGVNYRVQGFNKLLYDAHQIDIAGRVDVVKRILVGAGPVPLVPGQFIKQLVAQGDAAYITIQEPFAFGCKPGMFKSQALFDAQGRIQSWTPWQRVAGTDDQMMFAIKNRITDATMYVGGATSQNIVQTTWNNTGPLADFMMKAQNSLQLKQGGIQGIMSFPSSTQGFTDLPNAQVSLIAATGNGAVIIGQTGHLVNNESFEILDETQASSIVLDQSLGLDIGSVVTADFGNDASGNNWLFMAGDGGLAVLSKPNGLGFATLPNEAAARSLIAEGQTCKTLGSFRFVKKIAADGTYVYVMTQDAVYRFFALPNKFAASNPAPLAAELVVKAQDLAPDAYCTDMVVSHATVFLGTTAGLYSINLLNGMPGITTAIPIPGGLSTVSRLQLISDRVLSDNYRIGNLYVLSIDYSRQQAVLNRFYVENEVVTPVEDQLLQGQNGPLLIFDTMPADMFIDGSLGFVTSYRIRSLPPVMKYLQYTLQAGKSSTQILLKANTTNLGITSVLNSLGISAITREFATGALMIGTNFGLLADS